METSFWILTLTPVLSLVSYSALLVLVLRSAARSRLKSAFAFYLVVMAIWSLGSAMMRLDPEHILFWNRVLTGSGMATPLAFFIFASIFLNQEHRLWTRAGILILIGLLIANAFGFVVQNPRLEEGGLLSFELGPAGYVTSVYGFVLYALSIGLLVASYRRTPEPVLRNRIRYLLLCAIAVVLGGVTNIVSPFLGAFPVDHAINLVVALLLTYAVLRYQLVDITLVIRKGLLYSIPTAIIGVGYFLIISLALNLFQVFAGPRLLLVSLLVASITALAAQPLRDRAQLWIDRVFFREKYDASLMLQRISHTATSVLDLDRLASMILDEVTHTVHIARAALFLRQEEGGEYRLMAHRGLSPNVDIRLRSDHPLVGWLSGQEHALSRYEMDLIPQFKALWGHELGNLQEIGAELYIPLKAKDELVGILTFGPKLSEEAYSQDDLLTLTTLANQTATAFENARLHEETRRRYHELALLNRVISASTDSRSAESLLRIVCRELASTLGELQATAVLLNEERSEATIVTDDDSFGSASQHQATGLVAFLASEGSWSSSHSGPVEGHPALLCLLGHKSPLVMDDAWTDPRLAPILDVIRRYGIASLLCLPLPVEGEVLGLICLASIEPRPFTAEEVDLAQSVAEQVCGALTRARLAEAQQLLSAAIEQAGEAVMITDIDGTIRYVNPAFEQISGYSHAELIGHDPGVFGDGGAGNALNRQLQEAILTGQEWQGRVVSSRKDGTRYTGDTTITPVRNQIGEIVNYVATLRDVTRELQLEEQFRQSHKMEALGRLAGGIAHDFNNLLTVIQLSTRFVERRLSSEDPLWEHLTRIDETGKRAAKLTRQLLSFSRSEVIEPQVVDLNQLVSDLNRMLQRIIGEDIELALSLGQHLWKVRVDPSQMEQVILNLVVNARDAMPHGGALCIETANTVLHEARRTRHFDVQPGEYVMLVVSDAGVGMDEEIMTHLFEPFFTTKERGHGTGLGMSTVFGIVKQSEGHIELESEVQRGTIFRIYLPRTVDGKVESVDHLAPVGATGGMETILVVEDDSEVRQLTVQCLRTLGYTVLVASSGLEALQVSREHDSPIQLLLTDVVMPGVSGRELVEQLLPERPEMRVLYMSGHTDRLVVKQVSSDPNVAFLSKPFTEESLNQKVRSVLRDKSAGPQSTSARQSRDQNQ